MKYKVGDKVRVKSDLVVDKMYGLDWFARPMEHLRGKQVTIKELYGNKYRIKEDDGVCAWADEMLEPVEPFNVGDVVYDGSGKQVEIIEKVWRIKYDDGYSVFKRESQLYKTKPLQKITRKELAEKGYELVD